MIVFSDLHLREQSEEVCFKVLDEIKRLAMTDEDRAVVCCGDFWHIRYRVNVRLLNRVCTVLSDWSDHGIGLVMVPGNHDQVDVSGTNALEVFGAYPNVEVATAPLQIREYGFVPYRKDPGAQLEALALVDDATTIFSHFAIRGSQMNSGLSDRDGIQPVTPARLILGHYHKHQLGAGWQYVGSPYQTGFGEAGNQCGCVSIRPSGEAVFVPIDVGAPKHHIVEWNPAESDAPPNNPGEPGDHVRLDIRASQEMIVKGKFKGVLKRQGLDDAQVNLIPVSVPRDHRFSLANGETLLGATERFARERLSEDCASSDQSVDDLMAPLIGWSRK